MPLRRVGGGSRYKLPGPTMLDKFFFGGGGSINIFRLYKLSISDQTQITLKLRVRLSDFVQKYLDGQHLLGAQKTSLTGPESSLGSPETKA